MHIINTKRLISLGFGTIMLLMVLIVFIALDQMYLTFNRIEKVVNQNNIKTNLVSTMLIAARERTISIQKIASLDDPFDRDEEYMLFNRHGTKFAIARIKLTQLDLSEEEKQILEVQGRLTSNEIVPLQNKIVDLAMADRLDEVRALVQNQAISSQNKVFEQLYKLLNHIEKSSDQAVQDVSTNLYDSKTKLFIILTMIILGSLVISIYVVRRIGLTESQLSREKEQAQVTLHSIGDGVITTNNQGFIKYMNSVAEKLTGYSNAEARGQLIQNICPIFSELHNNTTVNPIMDVISKPEIHSSDGHAILRCADKNEFAIEYTASPIHDTNKALIGVVLVFRDVTSMRAMANQLSYQATHDELTGLINRREFENRIEHSLQVARIDETVHAMCYLDLDQFKVVNDTCGHVAGDELLRQLAKQLKQEIREGDTISRLGGDEFGILYLNCTMDKAKELAERLRNIINDFHFIWNNKSFSIGVSTGIAQINMYGNLNAILSSADTACYVAKDQGRNRIHCYKENDDELLEREGQMQWIHRITHALEENRFQVYCQPIYNISAAECLHYEILIRLIDEDGRVIPPMAFIPAAERYNLMNWIDRWMFKNTLKQISDLLSDYTEPSKISFSVNISAQSLCDDDFLEFVQDQFKMNRIDPGSICFEITETSAIVNLTRAQHFIHTLKSIGVKFSLDDFGSGLSSFAYLKNLPVDYLKIDGVFVRDIVEDPIDLALVESINQVGHIMGIKTIAEYVENHEIYEKLEAVGVDLVQGYYISKPIPLEKIELNEPLLLSQIKYS